MCYDWRLTGNGFGLDLLGVFDLGKGKWMDHWEQMRGEVQGPLMDWEPITVWLELTVAGVETKMAVEEGKRCTPWKGRRWGPGGKWGRKHPTEARL